MVPNRGNPSAPRLGDGVKKHRPKSLPDLLKMNRNAGTVYLALRSLSGERRQLNTTRQRITNLIHLSEKRISQAMQALDECGWVKVNYGRQGIKSWYRLSFPVGDFLPVVTKTTYRGRKVVDKNDLQGTRPCGDENDPHTLKGIGRTAPPFTPVGEGGGHAPLTGEHPSARIERERLAEIRKVRESGTPAEASP
jgi:hypothetical protein